jgi:phosphoribosyl 1,2-cyclic phosphate phosphodiesterase
MADTLKVTILGCGSSGGVPRIGGHWGACDPANPRNRRQRCSILAERIGAGGRTTVLVDTSPDMRNQLLDAGIGRLDAVLYSHEHADHTHGIDDLRAIALNMRARVPVYLDATTADFVMTRFAYCFETPMGSTYPPILTARQLRPGREEVIDGEGGPLAALPFKLPHGDIDALGYRFGGLAYTPDLNGVTDAATGALTGLDVWIVDALRRTPHPSHLSLDETLALIERFRPARAILTNMHIDLDYETLRAELPPGVEPAHDGMVVELALQT